MTKEQKLIASFLEEYKRLEQAVSNSPLEKITWIDPHKAGSIQTIYDLEAASLDSEICEKLKLCRIIRNYAQHNPGAQSFIATTQEMIDFVSGIAHEFESIDGTVKDIMTKFPATTITEASTLQECIATMSKKKSSWVPVAGKTGEPIAVVSEHTMCAALSSGATLRSKIGTLVKQPYFLLACEDFRKIPQDTPVASLQEITPGKMVIVNAKTRKIVGYMEKEKANAN